MAWEGVLGEGGQLGAGALPGDPRGATQDGRRLLGGDDADRVAVWALARDEGAGPGDPRLPVLVLATGATAFSIGLGGQDLALDRTAAIRWVPRRTAHVLLAGAVVAAALLTVQTMGASTATTASSSGSARV
ncbi:hypothetical protein [Streptomyces sp. NPDC001843]|uniref:hypothetical protein n=1 Tax=Streptomyces sp. NPDC001843 TaxID=3364617 RepID=UPI0036AB026C